MRICPHCSFQNKSTALFCRSCGQPLGARAQATGALLTGALLQGRYRIIALIGAGGMAAVYQAEDLRLPGIRWAIKEMSEAQLTDPAERQQAIAAFRQEAQLLAALSHPNLPKVTDYFSQAGKQYLVMEFVDGQNLEEIMAAAKPRFLDESQVVGWIARVCDVLTYLHSQQPPIIFRDLKPANIMLDRHPLKGAGGRIKLIDFGIVRHFKPGKTADTTPMGTPGYAAPEAYGRGQTNARSDIYSLGATLHTLLTRHDPTLAPFQQLPPVRTRNPSVSPHVEQVIQRATQTDSAHRYQSAAEMKQALFQPAPRPLHPATPTPGSVRAAATGATRPAPIPRQAASLPPHRTSPTRSIRPPAPGNRRPAWAWAIGAGLLLLVCLTLVGGLIALNGGNDVSYDPYPPPTTRTPTPTRKPTSTFTPTAPSPSESGGIGPQEITKTPTPTPSPTRTPTPTATPEPACAFQAQGLFASLWQTYRDRLGCPIQRQPHGIHDAEQAFQNGHMFWRQDNDYAYVLYEQGSRSGQFESFRDLWSEGDPEYSCSASPPPGLVQPKRGFGVVWCQLGGASAPIGWALSEEAGFGPGNGDPLVQDFEQGMIFRDSDGANRGMAYVLFFGNGAFGRKRY